MDITAAAAVLLQIAGHVGNAVDAYANPAVPTLPQVRSDAVDALNARRRPQRGYWTARQLFVFFAAFIRMELSAEEASAPNVRWIRSENSIRDFLLRGIATDRDETAKMLTAAMEDIPQMFLMAPKPLRNIRGSRSRLQTAFDVIKSAAEQRLQGRSREFALLVLSKPYAALPALALAPIFVPFMPIIGAVAGIAAGGAIADKYDRNVRVAVLREVASCLALGGLSTMESRAILLEQGLPESDVMIALRLEKDG